MKDVNYVFVYGTLRRHQVNDIQLHKPTPTWIGIASVMGCLFNMGWYPSLLLQEQCPQLNVRARPIKGEVYAYEKELEIQLDHIESILPTPNGEYMKKYSVATKW
ncbi:MAG: gamma-glutamylcyclotransferase [Limnohabitans sp.]|nr:gamma-glutamylcyclotransferase [Limnohabitans sp.]